MNAKLQNKLFKKYPKIFRQKDLPKDQTCMCWGIETGDGWYGLINLLCSQLQWDIDHNKYPQIEALQVKEKFGGLRFYYTYPNDAVGDKRTFGTQYGMIMFAEQLSMYICEKCGSNNNVKQTKGYITSLCKKCMKERRNAKSYNRV